MPELPEIEVLTRQLRARVPGATLSELVVRHPGILKRVDLAPEWFRGSRVRGVERRGKEVILDFERGFAPETVPDAGRGTIIVRLGMAGQFTASSPEIPLRDHTHALLRFSDRPFELRFRDPRRFGGLFLRRGPAPKNGIGVDPLQPDPEAVRRILAGRRGPIKPLLMDQSLFAGIGNIYASEILFAAGVHPRTPARRLGPRRVAALAEAAAKVLNRAIRLGGTSIRDYVSLGGEPGRFQETFRVYARGGRPCLRAGCGGTIRMLKRHASDRSTFYCPRCQRP